VALYFFVFEWRVMQKADRSFSLRASCFQIRKKQRYSVDGLMMFSCIGIQWMDLRELSFDHVLNVGGDHRLFLGCPLGGYKDSMQGFSGLGVCVFASKAFGLWQRLLGIIYFLLMGSSCVKIIFGFL
jgi:hypothetical protein